MLEHNRAMNISNKDLIHVNRFIRSASPKGSSQDRISEVDITAGLEPVIVGYLPACVLDRIVLPGVHVLRMLENFGRGFHPEVEGDNTINSSVVAGKVKRYHGFDKIRNALLDGREDPVHASPTARILCYCCLVKLLVRHLCLYAAR